jgi:hypothetical protein
MGSPQTQLSPFGDAEAYSAFRAVYDALTLAASFEETIPWQWGPEGARDPGGYES